MSHSQKIVCIFLCNRLMKNILNETTLLFVHHVYIIKSTIKNRSEKQNNTLSFECFFGCGDY